MTKVNIIVACDPNGLIGRSDSNSLPWHIPDDLKEFRRKTLHNVVIMGRKTYESLLNKPLEKRLNLVISRQVNTMTANPYAPSSEGSIWFPNLKDAIVFAKETCEKNCVPNKQIFIIGGSQIFKEALDNNLVDTIYMSRIFQQYNGDIFFPNISDKEWKHEVDQYGTEFDNYIYSKNVDVSTCI